MIGFVVILFFISCGLLMIIGWFDESFTHDNESPVDYLERINRD